MIQHRAARLGKKGSQNRVTENVKRLQLEGYWRGSSEAQEIKVMKKVYLKSRSAVVW